MFGRFGPQCYAARLEGRREPTNAIPGCHWYALRVFGLLHTYEYVAQKTASGPCTYAKTRQGSPGPSWKDGGGSSVRVHGTSIKIIGWLNAAQLQMLQLKHYMTVD